MASNHRQLLPFGLDWADMNSLTKDKTYEYPLPINGKPTSRELERINNFVNLVTQMKNSSFYTGNLASLSQDQNHNQNKKRGAFEYLEGGVNDGIKRYSDKYRKKIRIGRSISDHPFQHGLFPQELQSILGQSNNKRKTLAVSSYSSSHANDDLEKNIDKLMSERDQAQKNEIMDRLNDMEANAGLGLNDDDNDVDDEEEENIDDEFEDDDDDDYNAEKYFDDGDDYGGDDGGDDEAAF